MRIEQKKTRKEDGRSLIYYHFPATATPEETAVFAAITSIDPLTEVAAGFTEGSVSGMAETSTVYTHPSDASKGHADV